MTTDLPLGRNPARAVGAGAWWLEPPSSGEVGLGGGGLRPLRLEGGCGCARAAVAPRLTCLGYGEAQAEGSGEGTVAVGRQQWGAFPGAQLLETR